MKCLLGNSWVHLLLLRFLDYMPKYTHTTPSVPKLKVTIFYFRAHSITRLIQKLKQIFKNKSYI